MHANQSEISGGLFLIAIPNMHSQYLAQGNGRYHWANIYFTDWAKQDEDIELFHDLIAVNYHIIQVN